MGLPPRTQAELSFEIGKAHAARQQDQQDQREDVGPDQTASGLRVNWGPQIEIAPVEWLWHNFIPLGTFGLLAGKAKLGKSTLAMDIAARVSRGRDMPDGTPGVPASKVLLIAPEDGEGRALARFLEAGGDINNFGAVWEPTEDTDAEVPPVFPQRAAELEQLIRSSGARLVVIDNLIRVEDATSGDNDAKDTTAVLSPLQAVAKRTGAAILAIEHTKKGKEGDILDSVMGSGKKVGVARYVLALFRDKDNPTHRLLGVRGNYSAEDDGTIRVAVSAPNGETRVDWLGPSGVALDDAYLTQIEDRDDALGEAKRFLLEILPPGEPIASATIKERARARDISIQGALQRARLALRIEVKDEATASGRMTTWTRPTNGGSSQGSEHHRTPSDDATMRRSPLSRANAPEGEGVIASAHQRNSPPEDPQRDDPQGEGVGPQFTTRFPPGDGGRAWQRRIGIERED